MYYVFMNVCMYVYICTVYMYCMNVCEKEKLHLFKLRVYILNFPVQNVQWGELILDLKIKL